MDWNALFRDARKIAAEIEKEERRRAPKKLEDETWPEYLRRTRSGRRELLLISRVPERRCPVCLEIKLKSRQWILVNQRLVERLSKLAEQGNMTDETAKAFSETVL